MKKNKKFAVWTLIGICVAGTCIVNTVNANNLKNKELELGFNNEAVEESVQEFDNVLELEKDNLKMLNSADSKGVSEYIDADGNLYCFSQENMLVGYMKADYVESISTMIRISEDKAVDITQKCVADVVDNADKYSLSKCSYNENRGFYHVVYNYYVGECKTSDSISFNVSALGEIIDYAASDIDEYDSIKALSKDISTVCQSASEKMEETYPDLKDAVFDDIMIGRDDNGELCYNVYYIANDKNSGEVIKTKIVVEF